MAKKARKQQKQRRRAARIQKEKHRRRQALRAGPALLPGMSAESANELLEDMLPVLPSIADAATTEGVTVKRLMTILLESERVADEPEFRQIIFDPLVCAQTFVEVGTEMGIDPQSLPALDEEERENVQMDILEETARRLLTADARQEILNRLNSLRLRLKQSGKREEAARHAIMQSFLSSDTSGQTWVMTGLVQALIHRSLEAGFELFAIAAEIPEPGEQSLNVNSLLQRLKQSKVTRKADALLRRIPGIRGFLEKQADHIWEEGAEAIYEGNLYLGLFSEEELVRGLETFKTALGLDETTPPDSIEPTREKALTLIAHLDDYVTRLFTRERLGQLRARLDTLLNSPELPKKWIAFLLMLKEHMAHKDAVKNEKGFLIQALLGEMRAAFQAIEEHQMKDG